MAEQHRKIYTRSSGIVDEQISLRYATLPSIHPTNFKLDYSQ